MTVSIRRLVLMAVLVVAPVSAQAQDAGKISFQSVGIFWGAELDNDENWMTLGLDTRVALGTKDLELNPRFGYRSFDGGQFSQIDINVLQNYVLANPGRFRPFVGAGAALRHMGVDVGDGDTSVGLNLISGTRLVMSNGAHYEPFAHFQYTVIKSQPNPFSVVVGVSFTLN